MSAPVTSPRGRTWPAVLTSSLVASVATFIKVWVDAPSWIGWAPLTVSTWSDIVLVPASVLSGCLSWLAVGLRSPQQREAQALSGRPRRQIVNHLIVAALAGSAVLSIVTLTGMHVATAIIGGDLREELGRSVLWFIGTFAAMVAFALLGACLGWWIRRLLAVVVAVGATYLGMTIPFFILDSPAWSGLYAAQAFPWTERLPSMMTAGLRLAFWALAAVLVACWLCGQRKTSRWLALGMGGVVILASLQVPVYVRSSEAVDVVCRGQDTPVCSPRFAAAGLDEMEKFVREANELLPSSERIDAVRVTPVIPRSAMGVKEFARVVTWAPSAGFSSPTNLPDRQNTLAALGEQLLMESCRKSEAERDESLSESPVYTLLVWWRTELGIPLDRQVSPGDLAPAMVLMPEQLATHQQRVRDLQSLSAEERSARLETLWAQAGSCERGPVEVQ